MNRMSQTAKDATPGPLAAHGVQNAPRPALYESTRNQHKWKYRFGVPRARPTNCTYSDMCL